MKKNSHVCNICLDNIKDELTQSNSCSCKMVYHKLCLDLWYKVKPVCPICKTNIYKRNNELLDNNNRMDGNLNLLESLIHRIADYLIDKNSNLHIIIFILYSFLVTFLYLPPVFLNYALNKYFPKYTKIFFITIIIYIYFCIYAK